VVASRAGYSQKHIRAQNEPHQPPIKELGF